jgi:anti-sigma factor RsiW
MKINQIADNAMNTPEERFELLSAYIDGEVSDIEEQLVEQWLSDDIDFRRVYQQQLKLRQLLIDLPVPVEANSSAKLETEKLIHQVMQEIDRRSLRRKWKLAGLGISMAAVVGIFGSLFTVNPNSQFSPVSNSINSVKGSTSVKDEPIIVAMEEPLVPLPKSMRRN